MRWLYMILILILAAAGFGLRERFAAPSPPPPAKSPSSAPVPVTTATASRRNVPIFLQGLGNVQAYNTVTIRTQVDGQLRQVVFKEGQEVHEGDVLAQIDPRPFQAALDQTLAKKAQDEAQLANARHDVERYAALVSKQYVTGQQLDTARAQAAQFEAAVQGDEAAIENARVTLGYTTIKSPLTGRAGIRQVDQGNIVHPGDASGIVVITQVQPISVLFTLPEEKVPEVAKAMAAKPLVVQALSRDGTQRLDTGRLELIDNQIDPATGTARLKATFPNQNNTLWPGQFVNARLQIATLSQVLTVPAEAIQHGPQGSFVYGIKDDNTVVVSPVTVTKTSEGQAVIGQGLSEGVKVVTTGQYRLQPGAHVVVTNAEAK
ncbi:MAG: efflux RND transporter periplasmic adaptor subunit [Alphaproteobacteria bacterium]|nr:efflux RND transporter periplasmic adaptor subunit [Alphaproteobacteria bacterium]